MTLHQLQQRVLREMRIRSARDHADSALDDERTATRLIAEAGGYGIGRARYLARQAAVFHAAAASNPPLGTD